MESVATPTASIPTQPTPPSNVWRQHLRLLRAAVVYCVVADSVDFAIFVFGDILLTTLHCIGPS